MKGFIEVTSRGLGTLLVNIRQISYIQNAGEKCNIHLSCITKSGNGEIIYSDQSYGEIKTLIDAAG